MTDSHVGMLLNAASNLAACNQSKDCHITAYQQGRCLLSCSLHSLSAQRGAAKGTYGLSIQHDQKCARASAVQTGTLTENRMTVVEGWFAGKKYSQVPQPGDLPAGFFDMFQANLAVNSSVRTCASTPTWVATTTRACRTIPMLPCLPFYTCSAF